jgi:predicted PurR-regulated permease PerM
MPEPAAIEMKHLNEPNEAKPMLSEKIWSQDLVAIDAHYRTLGILLLAVYATGVIVMELSGVLKPFVLALFMSLVLAPLMDYLTQHKTCECQRKCIRKNNSSKQSARSCGGVISEKGGDTVTERCSRCVSIIWSPCIDLCWTGKFPFPLALLSAILFVFGVLTVIALIIFSAVSELMDNQEVYTEQFYLIINNTAEWATNNGYAITEEELLHEVESYDWGSIAEAAMDWAYESVSFFAEVMLFLVYILLSRNPIREFAIDADGNEVENVAHIEEKKVSGYVRDDIKKYLVTKTGIAVINGLLAGTLLALFGVPLAATFGLLTVFMDFIPNVGSILATLLPLPILFFDPSIGLTNAIVVFMLMGCMQLFVGEIVEPVVVGHQCNVHPLTVLLGLVFFGFVWGISGMILSIPIIIALKIVCEHNDYPLAKTVQNFIENNIFDPKPNGGH